ncbi:MAG: DUF3298 and DUF4163 domain-containing protein [Aureispira sp.]|nr:DUF3298 and DUF4163 domain-containing protein [Aureispira sp.]
MKFKQLYILLLTIGLWSVVACTTDKPSGQEEDPDTTKTNQSDIDENAVYELLIKQDTAYYTDQVLFKADSDTANVETEDVTKIILSFPIIDSFSNKRIKDTINEVISKLLLLDEAGDMAFSSIQARMDDFINDYKEDQEDMADLGMEFTMKWSCEVVIKVLLNSSETLSLSIFESNFTGGAHANSWTRLLNFDMQTGDQIQLKDLLVKDYYPKLLPIAENYFKESVDLPKGVELEAAEFEFEGGRFELPKNFAITQKGILFLYNPYEVGAFAMGTFEFLVPYQKIYHLVDSEKLTLKRI